MKVDNFIDDDDDIPEEEGEWVDGNDLFTFNTDLPKKRCEIPIIHKECNNEIEKFELDPDFDYNHVKCTPKYAIDENGNIKL